MSRETTVDDLRINTLSEEQYIDIENPSATELYLTPDESLTLDDVDSELDTESVYPVQNKVVTEALNEKPTMHEVETYVNDAIAGIDIPAGDANFKIVNSQYNIGIPNAEDHDENTILHIENPIFNNFISHISSESQRPSNPMPGDFVHYTNSNRYDVWYKSTIRNAFAWQTYYITGGNWASGEYDAYKAKNQIYYYAYHCNNDLNVYGGNIYLGYDTGEDRVIDELYSYVYESDVYHSITNLGLLYEKDGDNITAISESMPGGYAYRLDSDDKLYYINVRIADVISGSQITFYDSRGNEVSGINVSGYNQRPSDNRYVIYTDVGDFVREYEEDCEYLYVGNGYYLGCDPFDISNPLTYGGNMPCPGPLYCWDPEMGEALVAEDEYYNAQFIMDGGNPEAAEIHVWSYNAGELVAVKSSGDRAAQKIYRGTYPRDESADIKSMIWVPFGNSYLYNKNYAILPYDYNGSDPGVNFYLRLSANGKLEQIQNNMTYINNISDSSQFLNTQLSSSGLVSQAKACTVGVFPEGNDDVQSQMVNFLTNASGKRVIFSQNGGVGAGIIFCKFYRSDNDEYITSIPVVFVSDKNGKGRILNSVPREIAHVWMESIQSSGSTTDPLKLCICIDTDNVSQKRVRISAIMLGDFTTRKAGEGWQSGKQFTFSEVIDYTDSRYTTREEFELSLAIPPPPTSGNFVLASFDGNISWL